MTDPADTAAPAASPPRPRDWRCRFRRFLIFLTIVYVGVSVLLYFAQDAMIFPGSLYTNVPPVVPAPNEEVLHLPTPYGHVAALYARADHPDPASRPTLIYFYGNGACLSYERHTAEMFSQRGFNILIPEYPGYPMSPGKPSADAIHATADACYEHLTKTLNVPPARIGVLGQSIGGAPAIYLASKHPVGALATVSAFRSLAEIASNTVHGLFPVTLLVRHKFDNLERMKTVRCPTFLTHGTADELIPFTSAADLAKVTTAPVTLHPVENATHNDIYDVGGADLLEALEGFLKRSFDPPRSPAAGSE